MKMKRTVLLLLICSFFLTGYSQNYNPQEHAVPKSDRPDGRFLSSYGIVHEMLKDTHPKFAYRAGMSGDEFEQWQDSVRSAMVTIMKFPEVKNQPDPVCVKTEKGMDIQ